jgi:hypothetical protein
MNCMNIQMVRRYLPVMCLCILYRENSSSIRHINIAVEYMLKSPCLLIATYVKTR